MHMMEPTNLNPAHVMLLHLFHLFLHGCVQFGLEAQRLHVVHIAVAVEQIALQRCTRALLGVAGRFGLVHVIPTDCSVVLTDLI